MIAYRRYVAFLPGHAWSCDKLLFEEIPTNGSAAAGPLTVKVDAVDKFGTIDTTNTAAVTLAIAGKSAAGTEMVNAVTGKLRSTT